MRSSCLVCFIGYQLLATVASGQQERVIGVPVTDLGRGHQLIGKLHQPLGTVVHIQGVVVEGPHKGYEGGPNIRVQRIGGKATQEDIQISLSDSTGAVKPDEFTRIELKNGETYELQGFESGEFVGHPSAIWKSDKKDGDLPWIQTTSHYFALSFHFVRGKSIAAVKDSPADYIGRRALLEGVARDEEGKAIMEGSGWIVIVDAEAPWPKGILGKQVETMGMYNPGKPNYENLRAVPRFSLVDGTWRLAKLEDQLGQKVELRGTGMHHDGVFDFRGIDVYVENLENLPGWSDENAGQPIVIRGVLDKAKLPRIDQLSVKANRNLRDHYIVRKASWAPTSPLLTPERSAALRWIATDSIDDKDE